MIMSIREIVFFNTFLPSPKFIQMHRRLVLALSIYSEGLWYRYD